MSSLKIKITRLSRFHANIHIRQLKIYNKIINENRSCTLPFGSTEDRNSNADPSLHKSDWILTRSSLILLLGVKKEDNIIFFQ